MLDITLLVFQNLPTLEENLNENFLEWKNNLGKNKIKSITFEAEVTIIGQITKNR